MAYEGMIHASRRTNLGGKAPITILVEARPQSAEEGSEVILRFNALTPEGRGSVDE